MHSSSSSGGPPLVVVVVVVGSMILTKTSLSIAREFYCFHQSPRRIVQHKTLVTTVLWGGVRAGTHAFLEPTSTCCITQGAMNRPRTPPPVEN